MMECGVFQEKIRAAKTLGIDGKIQAIMALGIPAFKYPKYTDRKEIVKNYIE